MYYYIKQCLEYSYTVLDFFSSFLNLYCTACSTRELLETAFLLLNISEKHKLTIKKKLRVKEGSYSVCMLVCRC